MTQNAQRIDRIEGTAIALRGNDIDTDRIVPARFLRSVTFDGLADHLFEDDRRGAADRGTLHPFSNPAYRGASILIVNRNFGCGSSREHAPQALAGWGIRAVIGESFSDIFFSNAVLLGIPCLTLPHAVVEGLMNQVEGAPDQMVAVSLTDLTIRLADRQSRAGLPEAAQVAFLRGVWDATALLIDRLPQVRQVASQLPYMSGFEHQV